ASPSAAFRSMKLPMDVSFLPECAQAADFDLIAAQRSNAVKDVLLVTGASRGIGAATALQAARAGYAVAVNYASNEAAADAVVSAIRQQGGNVIKVRADVADEAQMLATFADIDERLGRLTALVNNAGVVDVSARLDEMSVER